MNSSNIKIECADKSYQNAWDNFVRKHSLSTPYHLWGFGDALSSTYNYDRYYLIAKTEDKVLALFPLIFIRSILFGNKLLSLPFCEYGGTLIHENSENSQDIMLAFLNKLFGFKPVLKDLDYVEIRNPKLSKDSSRTMLQSGFQLVKKYVTFKIDLTKGEDALWNKLDKKTRNSIRKAMKSNLTFYEANINSDLQKYYRLYLKTQKKHGSPPHSLVLFENLVKFMKENVKILIAEHYSNPVAGIIAFYDERAIYWWGGVSDPRFRDLNATNLLLWELIRWGCKKGCSHLDLGRTRPGSGIHHFKKGWSGKEMQLEDYIYMVKRGSKGTPDPSEDRFRALSKIWAKIPIPIAERFGPCLIKQIGL